MELGFLVFLDSTISNVQVCSLVTATDSGLSVWKYPDLNRGGSGFSFDPEHAFNLPELREGSFQSPGPSSGLCTSTTVKLPLTSVCRVTHTSYLSTLTHGPEEGKHLSHHPSSGVKVTDVDTGAEWVVDRIYGRRGKYPPE